MTDPTLGDVHDTCSSCGSHPPDWDIVHETGTKWKAIVASIIITPIIAIILLFSALIIHAAIFAPAPNVLVRIWAVMLGLCLLVLGLLFGPLILYCVYKAGTTKPSDPDPMVRCTYCGHVQDMVIDSEGAPDSCVARQSTKKESTMPNEHDAATVKARSPAARIWAIPLLLLSFLILLVVILSFLKGASSASWVLIILLLPVLRASWRIWTRKGKCSPFELAGALTVNGEKMTIGHSAAWTLVTLLTVFAILGALVELADSDGDNKAILVGQAIHLTIESDEGGYSREREGWYDQTTPRSEMSMVIVTISPGEFGTPNFDLAEPVRETSTDLPDRSAGEFEKLKLIRQDGKVYLEKRSRSSVDLPSELNFESKDEGEFIQGDWFEYEAGQTVSFRLSKTGMKTAKESFIRQLSEGLSAAVRLMQLEEIKQLKRVQDWDISDADLGRLVYVETEIDLEEFPSTVYVVQGNTISYSERRPTVLYFKIWMGITAENFPEGKPD